MINLNFKTTALTIYVPKKRNLKNKLCDLFLKLNRLLLNEFVRYRNCLITLFLVFVPIVFLCISLFSCSYSLSTVLLVYISDHFVNKFIIASVLFLLLSSLPSVVGKVSAVVYNLLHLFFISAILIYNLLSHFEIIFNVFSVIISSILVLLLFVNTVILFELSNYREYSMPEHKFPKLFYLKTFVFFVFSIASFIFFKILLFY